MRTRTEKNEKTGREVKIIETRTVEQPVACSKCGREPRQHASSRCRKCADSYRVQQANDNRLQRKIAGELQAKN